MSREPDRRVDGCRPAVFQVRVQGRLDRAWEDWCEGLTITHQGDDTLITGPVVDQAALHGLIRSVRDLGLPLVSVIRTDVEDP